MSVGPHPSKVSFSRPFSDASRNGARDATRRPLWAECVELIAAAKQTNSCFCAAPPSGHGPSTVRPSAVRQSNVEDGRCTALVRPLGLLREREGERGRSRNFCRNAKMKAEQHDGRKGGLVVGLWKQDGGLHAFFCPVLLLPGFLSYFQNLGRPTCWFSSLSRKQNVRKRGKGEKRLRSKRIPCLS